ncbi:MAG TPA: 50S ribosomal protein L35 [Coxiellaceae bacterium]|nr:50S ribosomal protein L35 [Coxiellaceae bacterium]
MPKLKTKSSAKKRFKCRGDGTIKCRHAFRNHILTKKTQKQKRQLRNSDAVNEVDADSVARQLCLK